MGLLYGVTVNRKATLRNPKGTILLYSLASAYKRKVKEERKYKSFKTFTHVYIILAIAKVTKERKKGKTVKTNNLTEK